MSNDRYRFLALAGFGTALILGSSCENNQSSVATDAGQGATGGKSATGGATSAGGTTSAGGAAAVGGASTGGGPSAAGGNTAGGGASGTSGSGGTGRDAGADVLAGSDGPAASDGPRFDGGIADGPAWNTSPLPASYNAVTYAFPNRDDAVACTAAGNATAKIEHVVFAQTHVLEPTHPLFFLIAKRPALVEVVVTGQGAAPEVRVDAQAGTVTLGSLCLKGPATLPATVDFTKHQKIDRYTATMPASWLVPGLAIKVIAGSATTSFSATNLKVGPAPELNLVMLKMDVLNYNDGKPDIAAPVSWLADMASAFPASVFRFGNFPVRVPLPKLASSTDVAGSAPLLLSKRPCEGTETPANTANACEASKVAPFSVLSAVNLLTGALHKATGETLFTYYYGNAENLYVGGLGSGKVQASAQFDGIMLHEQGHALDLPHWGEAYPKPNPGVNDYQYPYGGQQNDGGGRGESWNYHQSIDEFVSPICQVTKNSNYGKERSDAMQRSNACDEMRSTGVGPWDGFGDFSALAMFRYMTGAPAYSGTVSYRGANAPFHLKPQLGWPNLVVNADGTRSLVRENQPTATVDPWEQHLNILFPEKWDVPVAMVYGSFNPAGGAANYVYEPLSYTGNLTRVVDPTDPLVFADLAAAINGKSSFGDYFYWPRDITVKVTYQDGTTKHGVYLHSSYPREWAANVNTYGGPWRPDTVYFAIAFPGDKRIDKVEVFDRPFCVRYAGNNFAGNINYPANGITAANFMTTGATLRSTWTRP